MSQSRYITRGVLLNWLALATMVMVSFFLSPFIVQHLGNVAYGVWTIINSIVSYMGLLDLGLRGAVTRFVARDYTQGNHEEAGRTVSIALGIRIWIGVGILVISGLLALWLPYLFVIPAEIYGAGRFAVMVTGVSAAINLAFGVFGGTLAALHRFDLLSAVTIVQTLLRASGVIFLLRSGYGIGALAIWELIVVIISNTTQCIFSLREYPMLRIVFGNFDQELFRKLWEYSIYAFLVNACSQVIYYTDALVVGAFVSAGAVTFYAIGGGLIEYLMRLVSSLTMTFTPLASSLDAREGNGALRELLICGTRAALFVALPVQAGLFVCGETFIGLWMGAAYAKTSSEILRILLIAQLFIVANMTSAGIVFGVNKHRPWALMMAVEAIANIILSIILVRWIGLHGVAWGTVIPSLVTQLVFWPRYVCKIVDLSVLSYLWQAWVRSYVTVIPFAVAVYVVDQRWKATNLLMFMSQMVLLTPVFILTVVCCFPKETAEMVRKRPAWLLRSSRTTQTSLGKVSGLL
ncbi:MAG: MATE family efflux transporter [Candidatus Binatia bacterium]